MTFDIYLKDPQAEIQTSRQKPTSLLVIVSHRNRKYKKSIGISVLPREFVKGKTKNESVNLLLRKIRSFLAENLSDLSTHQRICEILSMAREMAKTGKDATDITAASGVPVVSLSEYLESWVERGGTSTRQRRLFKNNMARFFGKDIWWSEVDDAFRLHLENKMNAEKFSINYKRKIISQLRAVMEEGRKLHYHTNLAYKDWKVTHEYPEMIYLTKDEIDRIWSVELNSSMERKSRDLFIIGVYTVARYSDYSRVCDDIIHNGMIHFIHKKTSTPVCVPLAPRVKEVLGRNGGHAPKISQQKFNDNIKIVCRKAGIDSPVEYVHSHGTGRIRETKKKYELVTSHTARRTGATLLRLAGASMREVMLIGGWSSEKTLELYLRMTREENAEKMRDNPFFK